GRTGSRRSEPVLPRGRSRSGAVAPRASTWEDPAAVAPQASEIQLVECDGAHRGDLLVLECPKAVARHRRDIERREPVANRVEGPYRGSVDVLVVADHESVGEPIEDPGLARNLDDMLHGHAPF